jgi:hypothetical protein
VLFALLDRLEFQSQHLSASQSTAKQQGHIAWSYVLATCGGQAVEDGCLGLFKVWQRQDALRWLLRT